MSVRTRVHAGRLAAAAVLTAAAVAATMATAGPAAASSTHLVSVFRFTGAEQVWSPPTSNGTWVWITARGADGGTGCVPATTLRLCGAPGAGGTVTRAKLWVDAGAVLFVNVGGNGGDVQRGWNGGGTCEFVCSRGGGASDVRLHSDRYTTPAAALSSRVVVAGGGGGAGAGVLLDPAAYRCGPTRQSPVSCALPGGNGGAAGQRGADGVKWLYGPRTAGGGGGAGTATAGGAGGTSGDQGRLPAPGRPGGFGTGGTPSPEFDEASGGGGGGWYGGGSGGIGAYMNSEASSGGGGGGSSWVTPGATGAAVGVQGYRDAYVTIETCIPNVPCTAPTGPVPS